MRYSEERIKHLCDTAITNAQNIKVAVDNLLTLQFPGKFDYIDIIGKIQNKPRLECKIIFKSSVYLGYDASIKISTVKNNTRYMFQYYPSFYTNGMVNVPDWMTIMEEFESVCKNLTFEELQKLVTKFSKWMDISEAVKNMKEYIKEVNLEKDFK